MIGGRQPRRTAGSRRVAGLAGRHSVPSPCWLVTASSCSSSARRSSSPDTQPPIPLASSSVAPGPTRAPVGPRWPWATSMTRSTRSGSCSPWPTDLDRWTLVTPPGVASNGGLAASVDRPLGAGRIRAFAGPPLLPPGRRAPTAGSAGRRASSSGTWPRCPTRCRHRPTGHPLALLQSGGGTVGHQHRRPVDVDAGGLEADVGRRPVDLLVRDREADRGRLGRRCAARPPARSSAPPAPAGTTPGSSSRPATVGSRSGRGSRGAESGPTEVIRLEGIPGGAAALVSAGRGRGAELYALWSTDGLRTWTVSPGFPLGRTAMTATGLTPAGGFVVTTSTATADPGGGGRPAGLRVARPGPAATGHLGGGGRPGRRLRRPGPAPVGARRLHAAGRRMGSNPGAGRAHPVRIVRLTPVSPVRAEYREPRAPSGPG